MLAVRTRLAILSVAAAMVLCACPLMAQEAPVPPKIAPVVELPKAESVLTHIPDDAMGFVAVPNVQGTIERAEEYLKEVGITEMMKSLLPDGVLPAIKKAGKLGDGFNPNGGLALVMLDMKKFGLDLKTIEKMKLAGQEVKLPMVFLVPGTSIEGVFGNYPISDVKDMEGFKKIGLRMGESYAVRIGGYVALSPRLDALKSLMQAKKSVVSSLSKKHAEVVARSDVVLHIDMQVCKTTFLDMLTLFEKQIDEAKLAATHPAAPDENGITQPNPMANMESFFRIYLAIYREILPQLDAATISLRFGEKGLVFEEYVDFLPDSLLGKVLAAYEPSGKSLLNRLPNLTYVLAIGSSGTTEKSRAETAKLSRRFSEIILKNIKGLSEENRTKISKLSEQANEQITGIQVVFGGAPQGSGVFGGAMVLECRNSAKMKDLLAKIIACSADLINASSDDAEKNKMKIRYERNVGKVGAIDVDAISLEIPAITNMSDEERQEIKTVLGDERLRFS